MVLAARDILNGLEELLKSLNYGYSSNLASMFGNKVISLLQNLIKNTKKEDILFSNKIINSINESLNLEHLLNKYFNTSFLENKLINKYDYNRSRINTINLDTLYHIGKKITCKTNRDIKILSVAPSLENDIEELVRGMEDYQVTKYACFVPEKNIKEVRKFYDKTILGLEKGSTISNKVFDIVLFSPNISINYDPDTLLMFSQIRKEKESIRNTFKYVRSNGYLILSIPAFRMYADVCISIAKEFSEVNIYQDDNLFNNVVIIAKKRPENEEKLLNKEVYNKLLTCYDTSLLQKTTTDYIEYNIPDLELPKSELTVKFFIGSILDIEEIKIIANSSNCVSQLIDNQIKKKEKRKSILPFSINQVGLVITGGENNGIITDDDNNQHLIKGQVINNTYIQEQIEGDEDKTIKTVNTITSNRVAINCFLASGEHKVLA